MVSVRQGDRVQELGKLMQVVEDGKALNGQVIEALQGANASHVSKVDEKYQMSILPSGCEIVSLSIALDSMGIGADPEELADNHLFVDGDYTSGYIASPYGESGGCLPAGLVQVGDSYLQAKGLSPRCHDLSGSGFEGLEALASLGYPVLVWTTLNQDPPVFDEGDSDWWINEHCVVMYACDDDTVYISDPIEGFVTCDRETFESVYEECGSYALYVR
jgi:uncharacterized protein YvpB